MDFGDVPNALIRQSEDLSFVPWSWKRRQSLRFFQSFELCGASAVSDPMVYQRESVTPAFGLSGRLVGNYSQQFDLVIR